MEQTGDIFTVVLAGFFFLIAFASRTICITGFVERPLVIGFAWWLCTGDFSPALPLALFFELFWLDLFPIGGYIPPMAAFPYLLLLSFSSQFGWAQPSALAFPLAAVLPLAYLIPYAESWQRDYQKYASSRLIRQAWKNAPLGRLPGRRIAVSALQQLFMAVILFSVVYLVCYYLLSLDMVESGAVGLVPLDVGWPVLYFIAAIGSLLSLRIKRAYIVFSVCMAALLFIKLGIF